MIYSWFLRRKFNRIVKDVVSKKEYKLNRSVLMQSPSLPNGEILMININKATKEYKMWEDVEGNLHLLTKTPPQNSVILGIAWNEIDKHKL